MTVFWIVLIVGAVALIGVLTARQMRAGKGAPGAPTSISVSNHDEPLEDVARAVDQEHHHRTTADEVQEYRDIGRTHGER
jgi:hypothetical protein